MSETQRYPLSWPVGWKRTPYGQRRRAAFGKGSGVNRERLDVSDGVQRLFGELRRLGASGLVVSSNLHLRDDGYPYAKQPKMLDDPGVAVYFTLSGAARVLACDLWNSVADNMAAIAGHIEAARAQGRYGVGSLEQAFAGYAALPANTAANWRDVFGFKADQSVTWDDVSERFRDMARRAHPDAGGTDLEMARLSEAKSFAKVELNV